ncbi:MAG TPA: tyrosine-type recombinase/integrase [Solirubrobacteraceae bacterium]
MAIDEAASRSPRRKAVQGKPGIYFREVSVDREGKRRRVRRYEVSYLDSDGRRRWQTIPGHDNLDEAERELVRIKVRLADGERVDGSGLRFDELADLWLSQLRLSERTRERYEANLRTHLRPRFGTRKARLVTTDDVAKLVADMEASGRAGWTTQNVLTTLSSLCSWAARHGFVAANPVAALEARERPRTSRRPQRAFQRDEIKALLAAAKPPYRVLLATAIFSGLRLMELLALRWQDIDFESGEIHVRAQLSRTGELRPLKSDAGLRDVVLMPELAQVLQGHRSGCRYSEPHDYVFTGIDGRPLNWRSVETTGFNATLKRANLAMDGREQKPVLHDCRHTFASLLIAQGLDIVFISRQLGHASPATTLRIYTHLLDQAKHAARMRNELSANFGQLIVAPPEPAE